MKIYPLILSVILFLVQCNTSNNFSEIKIGMTYNEVEDILGKPKEITRGANELETDYDNIPDDLLKRLNLELDTTDVKRWYAPKTIKTIGNLIYVNWVYKEEIVDTFYIVLDIYKNVKDTVYNKIPVYYINDKIVTKKEFTKIKDKEKYIPAGFPKNTDTNTIKSKPVQIEKRIEYNTEISINNYEVKSNSIEKIFYFVKYKHCILFDASSGRVTETGFFPFYIINNNNNL